MTSNRRRMYMNIYHFANKAGKTGNFIARLSRDSMIMIGVVTEACLRRLDAGVGTAQRRRIRHDAWLEDFNLALPLHEIVETEMSGDQAAMRGDVDRETLVVCRLSTPAAIMFDIVVHVKEETDSVLRRGHNQIVQGR